jgi:hypothetical protein
MVKYLPLIGFMVVLLPGCHGGEESTCLEALPGDCAALYEPVFEQVYQQTLASKCAVPGGACHAAAGAKGGLALEGIDAAYDNLLADGVRVVPGDPECSVLVHRLESTDSSFVMPVGAPLSQAERCAIQEWIRNGALR